MTHARATLLLGIGRGSNSCPGHIVQAFDRSFRGLFSPHEKHIAVLPFDLKGEAQELAIVVDGLMAAFTGNSPISTAPTRTSGWSRQRSQTPRCRRSRRRPPRFGATIVVRGHFSRLCHGFRLTLELIDVRKMSEIGYADIDRPDGNLAAFQGDAVERMGRLLNVSVDKSARGDEAGASGSSYNDYVHALGYLERYDNNLGVFSDRTGRHSEAVRKLPRHALDLTPDNAFVVLNLGGAYIDSNDPSLYPQAEKVLRRSVDLNPTFDAYTNLGNLYLLERRYPGVIARPPRRR